MNRILILGAILLLTSVCYVHADSGTAVSKSFSAVRDLAPGDIPVTPDTSSGNGTIVQTMKLRAFTGNPSLWKVVNVKSVAGTTRIYLRSQDNETCFDGVDTTNPDAIKAVESCYGVKIENMVDSVLVIDSDPVHHFNTIEYVYSPEGDKATKAVAQALFSMTPQVLKEVKIPEVAYPVFGLDRVFLARVLQQLRSIGGDKWSFTAGDPKQWMQALTEEKFVRSSTLLHLKGPFPGEQRVVIEPTTGSIYWLDARPLQPLSDEEMRQIKDNPGAPDPTHENLARACDLIIRHW